MSQLCQTACTVFVGTLSSVNISTFSWVERRDLDVRKSTENLRGDWWSGRQTCFLSTKCTCGIILACCAQTAPLLYMLCKVRFYYSGEHRGTADHFVFFIDMHWWIKTLPEYLKTVLRHVTENINFIRAKTCIFKVHSKVELIDRQRAWFKCFISISYLATVSFTNLGVD